MVAAAVIGAVATAGAAYMQSEAAGDAADQQAGASAASIAEQRRQYDQTRADTAPYRDVGTKAVTRLSELLGLTDGPDKGSLTERFTGESLPNDPGYQFGLSEGLKGVQNSMAARGGLYSGAAMKGINRYANDYAGTKFNEAFNRDQTEKLRIGNQLAGVAGTGQTATTNLATIGANTANQIGNALTGAGDARASGYLASGSAYGNAFNNAAGMGINYLRANNGGYNNGTVYSGNESANNFMGPPSSSSSYNYTPDTYYGPYQ